MSRGGFDYRDFKEKIYKPIQQIKVDYDRFIRSFILQEALRALRLTRNATPVDTGNLRRSWEVVPVERHGDTLTVALYNPVEYASYIEYGHTVHTRQGDWFLEGCHMAELSVTEVANKMPQRYKPRFEQWIKTRGWV